jgi:hypothetical protein
MTIPSAQTVREGHGRLTFQEAMSLVSLPHKIAEDGKLIKRYMSRRKAWVTGDDLIPLAMEHGASATKAATAAYNAYGGHVYAQAGLAVSRAFRSAQETADNGSLEKKFGIHVSFSSWT